MRRSIHFRAISGTRPFNSGIARRTRCLARRAGEAPCTARGAERLARGVGEHARAALRAGDLAGGVGEAPGVARQACRLTRRARERAQAACGARRLADRVCERARRAWRAGLLSSLAERPDRAVRADGRRGLGRNGGAREEEKQEVAWMGVHWVALSQREGRPQRDRQGKESRRARG